MVRAVQFHLAIVVTMLTAGPIYSQAMEAPSVRIAVLGNPVHQVLWNDDAMEKLKVIGFNEVQLNIAWGSRPFGEPLNLRDIITLPGESEALGVAERRAELKRRVALAKRHGLRTLFHFGSPYMGRNPYSGEVSSRSYAIDDVTYNSWYDTQNPKVRDHEIALLREFRRQFPDVDDILVYSYDQDAWETPEFQYDNFSYGVPLSERLPLYLTALHDVWTEERSGRNRMWWEPWELSAGQVYDTLPKLPRTDFGLIIHANIAEAQIALPVDVWFRNTARMCLQLNIPVVAESFFASATEEIEPLSIPAVRLVDEEYTAFLEVPGIAGIKEYYGINTDIPDLDIDMLRARLHGPSSSTSQLINAITSRFGQAQNDVLAYLELLASAIQMYPWDASWFAREVGTASTDHGWRGATIQGASFDTPSWESTRHAKFMKTDKLQPHFWMLEDVQLRCKASADLLDKATDRFRRLESELGRSEDRKQFEDIQKDVDVFRRVSRSYELHLRETNIAQMLRQDLAAGRPMNSMLTKELESVLDRDVVNQGNHGRVVEMRRLYIDDPKSFIQRYLVPVAGPSTEGPWSPELPPIDVAPPEKGDFTLTTR